jgi:hypothetical protein
VVEEVRVFVILGSSFNFLFIFHGTSARNGQTGGLYQVRKPQEIKFCHTVTAQRVLPT